MTLPPPSSEASPHFDLLIIGAGIAGLAAGRMAKQAGLQVLLIDKGRRIGGRVSTRRIDGFVFNHGAQFATSKSSDLGDVLRAANTAGMATNWQIEDKKTVVIGTPMMRAIPMFLEGKPAAGRRSRLKNVPPAARATPASATGCAAKCAASDPWLEPWQSPAKPPPPASSGTRWRGSGRRWTRS